MLLSICIPTYNRASTLELLLNRISEEVHPSDISKVEVIVCDNHSTDHTEGVVAEAKKKTALCIKYIKHPENKGLIKNLFSTVEYASGEFCWLMGSDDSIEKGAISRVLSLINNNTDVSVFIPQFRIYDAGLGKEVDTSFRPIHRFENGFVAQPFDKYAKDIVYEFGFLSVLIFRRDHWNNVPRRNEFENNFYYHVYIIVKIAQQYKLMLVQEKLIAYRSDNDSVLSNIGVYNRIRIIVEEYQVLLKEVFTDKTYKENMQMLLRFHVKGSLQAIQTTFSLKQRFKMVILLFKYFARDSYFLGFILPQLFVPTFLNRLVWKYKKR